MLLQTEGACMLSSSASLHVYLEDGSCCIRVAAKHTRWSCIRDRLCSCGAALFTIVQPGFCKVLWLKLSAQVFGSSFLHKCLAQASVTNCPVGKSCVAQGVWLQAYLVKAVKCAQLTLSVRAFLHESNTE